MTLKITGRVDASQSDILGGDEEGWVVGLESAQSIRVATSSPPFPASSPGDVLVEDAGVKIIIHEVAVMDPLSV